MWEYLYNNCDLGKPISYLEFGVYKGDSIRWWTRENTDPASRFVGFDSFQGLPQDWHPEHLKGHFSTDGRIPDIRDERCSFKVGLFSESLPKFLTEFQFDHRLVVHLDADLHGSTLYVLCLLRPYLKPGDILIFDEFSDGCHEFRAFYDFLSAFDLNYVALANGKNFWHFALQVTAH